MTDNTHTHARTILLIISFSLQNITDKSEWSREMLILTLVSTHSHYIFYHKLLCSPLSTFLRLCCTIEYVLCMHAFVVCIYLGSVTFSNVCMYIFVQRYIPISHKHTHTHTHRFWLRFVNEILSMIHRLGFRELTTTDSLVIIRSQHVRRMTLYYYGNCESSSSMTTDGQQYVTLCALRHIF